MRAFVLLVSALAIDPSTCRGGSEPTDATPPPVTRDGADTKAPPIDDAIKPDPCSAAALRLENAAPLPGWQIPDGCTPGGGGTGETFLRSQADLTARVPCPPGVAHGVDFNKNAVLAVGYHLSPAGAGMGAFDDGKVITLVTRQRSPCPDDPRPMPMNTTAWFLVPAGGERTFANTICTIESKCR